MDTEVLIQRKLERQRHPHTDKHRSDIVTSGLDNNMALQRRGCIFSLPNDPEFKLPRQTKLLIKWSHKNMGEVEYAIINPFPHNDTY